MISKGMGIIAALAVLGLVVGIGGNILARSIREAAVATERRERMADAIELIRESDKTLGTMRKASDADLCRAMGGSTVDGVCQ